MAFRSDWSASTTAVTASSSTDARRGAPPGVKASTAHARREPAADPRDDEIHMPVSDGGVEDAPGRGRLCADRPHSWVTVLAAAFHDWHTTRRTATAMAIREVSVIVSSPSAGWPSPAARFVVAMERSDPAVGGVAGARAGARCKPGPSDKARVACALAQANNRSPTKARASAEAPSIANSASNRCTGIDGQPRARSNASSEIAARHTCGRVPQGAVPTAEPGTPPAA